MPAPSATAPASICIVRLSALGDVVMVLPLIKMLRRNWPAARITWIVGRDALPLVAPLANTATATADNNNVTANNNAVEIIPIEKPRRPADYLALRRQFKNRDFDALLCLQASWRANLIYPCIRARRKIGYSPDRAKDLHALFTRERIPPAPPRSHIIDGFFQFAETLGAARDASDYAAPWGLAIAPEARAWAAQTLPAAPWLAVAPCASKHERNWAPENYATVIAHAWRARKMPAILLGGPGESDRALSAQIRHRLDADVTQTGDSGLRTPDSVTGTRDAGLGARGAVFADLTGQTTLPQLAAAIAHPHCAALLAPDTGAVHIARAFGRPVIGLYAVAPATRTGPYRETGYCIDKFAAAVARFTNNKTTADTTATDDATTDTDATAALPWSFRVHDPRAMQLITPDEVRAQLAKLLNA